MNTLIMLEATGDVLSFGERAGEALQVSLLGMATIFSVLAIIWGVLELFRVIFSGTSKKEDKKPEAAVDAPAVPVANNSNDEETVAAIMAAISVVTDKPVSSFRVVSFRKTGTR